jgi:transmembrane 9 superfamily protein 2/4
MAVVIQKGLATAMLVVAVLPLTKGIFYLPGVAPRSYEKGESVRLFVNKLTSTKTQIPYDYYSLPFCHPSKIQGESENLGEVLVGDRIEKNTLYELNFKVQAPCQTACRVLLDKQKKDKFIKAIDQEYRAHWIVDNLPVAVKAHNDLRPDDAFFIRGFPVGGIQDKKHFLFNHIRLMIKYHEERNDVPTEGGGGIRRSLTSRIVGFLVEPYSVRHKYEGTWPTAEAEVKNMKYSTCSTAAPVTNRQDSLMTLEDNDEVIFTYDVEWIEDKATPWAHRWDLYLKGNPDDKIHWFSITNSTMIVFFLAGMVAMILVRALHRDISRYNESTAAEDAKEEYGWKLVHADVFRPPQTMPTVFAAMVGSGVHLLVMTFVTLVFALLGFLSPANRGSLVTAFVLLFVFLSSFAGYASSRIYKMFRGTDFKRNTLVTAFLFPGVVFSIFLALNAAVAARGSTLALPVGYFFLLIFLWFGISVPLVFVGSYFGYKKPAIEHPVRTNIIARGVPPQPWYMHPALVIIFSGILPFGAVSVELFFIMTALWLHQFYYIFGFLFLAVLILVATCAEMTIVMTYFQICNEDYRWWWRSFLCSGSCALYIFLYSIWYLAKELQIDEKVGMMLYFGHMTVFTFTFFLLTGAIGFYAAFWFNHRIYSSIKVD